MDVDMTKDAQIIKPRRPHNKSRVGCAQCKMRKVKCDETKPMCKKCTAHGQTCSFLQTTPLSLPSKRGPPTISSMLSSGPPTPASSVTLSPAITSTIPAQFTILDLELLHSWTVKSSEAYADFPACIEVFKVGVVQLGFSHKFVMLELLAISALHLSLLSTDPSERAKYTHASTTHLATALTLFQPEIANLTIANCHACFAFSTLVFTHSWAAQDEAKPSALFFIPKSPGLVDGENVQWIKLHRGAHKVLQGLWAELRSGPFGPLFQPWVGLDRDRPDPLNEVEDRALGLVPLAWNRDDCNLSAAQKQTLDANLKSVKRTFSMLEFHPEISKLSVVMAWFSWITDDFLKMLQEKIPESLLLVAYYCVALKRAEYMWWVEGKAENLLRTVVAELDEPGNVWSRWLSWPVEQVLGGEVIGLAVRSPMSTEWPRQTS